MTDQEWQRLAGELHRSSDDARPGADCPPAERIWGAVTLELARDERLAILDHTAECPTCAEAWRIALAVAESAQGHQATQRNQFRWRQARRPARVAAALLAIAATLYLIVRVATPRIDPGTTPDVPARPPILVSLNDGGGAIRLAADGTLSTPTSLSTEHELQIKNALTARQIALAPQLDDLDVGGGTLMGPAAGQTFTLDAPVGTAVETDRPTFVWSSFPGAVIYEVTVSDIADYREVLSSPLVRATTWVSTAPLPRGRTYSWQVVGRTKEGEVKAPSPREGEARFHVLPLDAAESLATARREHGENHLLLGILYANAGVLDAADAEFSALAAANPTSALVRDLQRSVRERRTQP